MDFIRIPRSFLSPVIHPFVLTLTNKLYQSSSVGNESREAAHVPRELIFASSFKEDVWISLIKFSWKVPRVFIWAQVSHCLHRGLCSYFIHSVRGSSYSPLPPILNMLHTNIVQVRVSKYNGMQTIQFKRAYFGTEEERERKRELFIVDDARLWVGGGGSWWCRK